MLIDTVRDIAIIIVAVFNIVQAIVLIALFAAIYVLVRKVLALWPKVESIIDKAGDTAGTVAETTHTVSATTSYVSRNVVSPLIKLIAFIMGIRRAIAVLFAGPKARESSKGGSENGA